MASEAVDMRCGFDRLSERVRAVIGQNPPGGHLLVIRSRRGDRLLESGVFKLPKVEVGARSVELRASELAMVPDGIDVSRLKLVAGYERGWKASPPHSVIGITYRVRERRFRQHVKWLAEVYGEAVLASRGFQKTNRICAWRVRGPW